MKLQIKSLILLFGAVFIMFLHPGLGQSEMARFQVDPDHSTIGFQVAHLVISKTKGEFNDYTGFIVMDPEAKQVKDIEAVIKTQSVDTKHEKRDKHLKSDDFFNVEKYPTITYKMKSYKKDGNKYKAIGDLTLKGVTKEITLLGEFNGQVQDPWGNTRAGFSAEGTINRKDFGMDWNKVLDTGGLLVGDEIKITLEIETIKEKKEEEKKG